MKISRYTGIIHRGKKIRLASVRTILPFVVLAYVGLTAWHHYRFAGVRVY